MNNIKILLVEDEAIVAMDIKIRIEKLGYIIPAIASTGEDAIKMAAEICPDLVLMDINLGGGMDGVEAAEQIHKRIDIPIIYLTAYADEKTLSRAKITKPFGYILKPFEERELQCAIEFAIYHNHPEKGPEMASSCS
ncbi:MAG: response regulator [Candidatus Methanoperedens sp.]